MPYILKNTTLSLSLTAVLFGSLAITACSQQPTEQTNHSNKETTEKSDEHAHDEHKHEAEHGHKHEHEHEHDEHEHKHEEEHHHNHDHEHKEGEGMTHHGKHVHGEAELTAVVDANQIVIELHSPAMNVFGFEHEPSTDEQKSTVEKQEALLTDAGKVISMDGGDCTATKVDIDMPFTEHAEHEHGNDHEHNHEEKPNTDEQHAESEKHSDITATYTYTCKDKTSIKGFQTLAFKTFAGFTKINVNWVNGDKQGATSLTKENYNVSLIN